jgi:hypothetical protein
MVKPELDVLSSIISLENNQNFHTVIHWIDISLTTQLEKLPNLRGESTIIMQGRCSELIEILGAINGARDGIEAAKREAKIDKTLGG